MKVMIIITFLLVELVSIGFSQHVAKVHVTILYETLCPDSIHFVQSQLKPAYTHLKDFIDIKFVPFGKSASYNNGEYFVCQHGQDECTGNMIQSCALNELYNKPISQQSFVTCQMDRGANINGKHCSESVGIIYQNVLDCYYSGTGTKLQLEAEQVTSQIGPKFIPTIFYNNEFNQELQDRSLKDFKGVVCELINYSAPICSH